MTIQTSTIDSTKPIAVTPTTQSVRDNFAAAAAEINQCFINDDTLKARVLAVENLPATFAINAVQASQRAAQTFLANTPKIILYSTLDHGDAANYNAATSEYTCQATGLYMVSFSLLTGTNVGNSVANPFVFKNGAVIKSSDAIAINPLTTTPATRTIYVKAAAGDKLTVWLTSIVQSSMKTVSSDPWEQRNHVTFLRAA